MEEAERTAHGDAARCPEQAMGIAAARLLALLAAPVIVGAWWIAGVGGALGAGAGLLLVLALFGVTGLILSRVRVGEPAVVVGVSLAGVGLRITGYAVALQALTAVNGLHRPSLAVATFAGFLATLAYEIHVIGRTPQLFWVRAGSG